MLTINKSCTPVQSSTPRCWTFQAALIVIVFSLVGCDAAYVGEQADHFDGKRFFHDEKDYTFRDTLKWMLTADPAVWPDWIEDPPQPPPPADVEPGALRITHINHATMLIQMDGVNLLTDPIWSERSSPVTWAGPKRVRAAGVKIADLPRIDIILISHNHYDHLDIASLEQIMRHHSPYILVGLGVGDLLRKKGFSNVIEMNWWQEHSVLPDKLKIVFVPARHGSARGLFDRNKTLWGSFVIQSASGNVYFAGDTAYGKFLASIRDRYPKFRLAILPIGHYEPRWMMQTQHLNPDDAVKLHRYLNVRQSVGMHFGTFGGHNDEEVDAHEKDLQLALVRYGTPSDEFWVLGFGEGRDVP